MTYMRWAGVAALALLAAGQARSDVTGGEIRLGYGRVLDETASGDTPSALSLEGAMVFEMTPDFSLQTDLTLDRYGILDGGWGGAVHAFWRAPAALNVGAFAGYEAIEDADVTFWGIEAAAERGLWSGEAQAMRVSERDDAASGTVLALEAAYAATSDLSLGGKLAGASLDGGAEIRRAGLTAAYRIGGTGTLTGEIGHSETALAGAGASEGAYLGLEARFDFGPGQGAVFGRRGLGALIPGL